jgi:Helix-turn-helix domain
MSIPLTNAVWKHSKQKSGGLVVLLAIADYANQEGNAWPAVSTLAKKTRMSPRNVQRWLRKIECDGELLIIPNQSGHRTNTFRVCVCESKLTSKNESSDPDDADVGNGVTPASPIADASVSQSVSEPSIEPSSLSKAASEKIDLIQHAEAKQLFSKLSEDVFGTPLRDSHLPKDIEYWLDRALPLRREDWELIDWFYRLPDDHEVFTMTYSRQSMAALMENLPREIEKVRSIRKRLGLKKLSKKAERESRKEEGWTRERWAALQALFPGAADPGPFELLGRDIREQIDDKVLRTGG